MTKRSATVHVNKLAAAQRQLRAAIRMFFAEEDDLAIHTVASAAYQLIKDIKMARGKNEAADFYLTSIFYAVRDYRRDTLPSHMTSDPELMDWVRKIARELPIEATSKLEEVSAYITPDDAKKYWSKRNKAANFLKHADKDANAHLALDEIDNRDLIMQALSAYSDLLKDGLGAEGRVFWLFSSVSHGESRSLPEKWRKVGDRLLAIDGNCRREFCAELIEDLNAKGSNAGDA